MSEKKLSRLEMMRQRTASSHKNSDYSFKETEHKNKARCCPNCGAGRAEDDGLRFCAFCGFEFINRSIEKGIYLKEEK